MGSVPFAWSGHDDEGNVVSGAGAVSVNDVADPANVAGWGLPTWRDEFDTTLDTTKWAAASGAVGTDSQGYRQTANVFTSGGNLVLRAVKLATPITAPDGSVRTWGSAWVDCKMSARFGRWEIRYQSLKPLQSKGIWPGPWLRADGAGGEADISECMGTHNNHPTYYPDDGSASSSTFYKQTGVGTVGVDRTAGIMWKHKANPDGTYFGWHTAVLEWTPTRMSIFADGAKVAEVLAGTTVGDAILAGGFPGTAHLRYTVHVGDSGWGGVPDATTLSPYDVLVDYVRYWPLPAGMP